MTYRTSVSDPFSRMVSFVAVSFIGMVVVFSLVGLYNVWIVLGVYLLLTVGLSYFLMRFLSCGLVETVVMNDRLHMRWLKPYILSRQDDREIHFKDIEEHEYIASRITRSYTLLLADGSEVSYNQFNLYVTGKEDIEGMGRDIWEAIDLYHHNNPEPDSGIPLGYEKKKAAPLPDPNAQRKTIWRTTVTVLGIIAIYLFVGFAVLKMGFPSNTVFWEFKMLAAFTGILLLFAKAFGVIYEKWQKARGTGETEQSESGY